VRALVTGATGFLGSRLTRRLVADGHAVAILTRPGSNRTQLDPVAAAIDVVEVDETPECMRRAVAGAQPDVVFHTATYYARDHRPEDIAPLLEANVAFPLRLIDAMAREGVRRLVNTGSAWQYTDEQTYRPVCLHSATKAAFEALLGYFTDGNGIDAITLVMHDSYGPGDPRRKIFSILRERAASSEPFAMSAGEQLIDLIHVDDAVDAFMTAAHRLLAPDRTPAAETYSLSGGSPLPLRQVVDIYLRGAGLTVPIHWGSRPYHPREVMVPWTGGARLPGWQPRIAIAAGLEALAREHAASG
jgi:nucleoside-diphosphate-sugar epimerase